MMRKVDKRIERTRSAIIKAFKEMIIEKDFNDITIKELAIKAGINRKTFYLHYESMEEILFDLSLELSDQILQSLISRNFFDSNNDEYHFDILIDAINDVIVNEYDLCKKLITNDTYHFFVRNIKNYVKESFIIKISNKVNIDKKRLNLIGDYMASGLAKLLKEWFIDPGDLTSQDIASLASNIIYNGINAFNNKQN